MNQQAAAEAFYAALLDDDPEQLYDSAPCGYLTTAPDGTVVKCNATFEALTGYSAQELVGKRSFAELLTPGGRIYHETHYDPLLRMQGTVREVAFDLVRADGARLPVLVNAVLDCAGDGTPKRVRIALFDATHRREYERELLRAKERAEQSEEHAQTLVSTLQSTLLPPSAPAIPGLDVSAAYRPAGDGREVGGDFYDIFQIATGDWVVVVGDVCGKGVEAAMVTALVRHTIRAMTVEHDDPRIVLAGLNEVLLREETDRFCSVVLLRLRRDADDWSVTVATGGHPLPLVVSPSGRVEPVGVPGSLMGLFPDAELEDAEVTLAPGHLLVVYTDGVTEGRADRLFYGEEGLHQSVIDHVAADQPAKQIVADVVDFQRGQPRDDIAVVALRVPDANRGSNEAG